MTTALSGGITVLESDSSNQDWVGSGGDPDNIDLDNFLEGSDYIHIKTTDYDKQLSIDISKESFPGDFQIATPLGQWESILPVTGFVDDLATANLVEKFCVLHNNLSDNPIYVVIKHGANEYRQFPDDTRTMKDYAKGWISSCRTPFNARKRRFDVQILFEVTWDD